MNTDAEGSRLLMTTKKYQMIVLLPFLLMSGCSGEEEKTTQKKASEKPIFSEQAQALEKAKGVEQIIMDGADKQRHAIDEQSQ